MSEANSEATSRSSGAALRTRALLLGIATGLGSRVLTLAAPLLTIPVTLHYLGADLFGFWMIVTSITAIGMFADLGLGNGLLTRLVWAVAEHDAERAKTLVSTAYLTLGGVALMLLAVIWLVVPSIDWQRIESQSATLQPATAQVVAGLALSAFAITIPLSLVQRVQYALQEAWKSNTWQVAGAIATIAAVYAAALLDLGVVAVIAAAVFAGPFVILLNNVFYYAVSHRELTPTLRTASTSAAGSLLRVGFAFFFLSILTSVSLNVDNLIVAKVADLPTVSQFAITTKLFALLALAVTLVALPLWPANGEALARGDVSWVRRTTRAMVLFSVGAVALGGIVLVLARNLIAQLWLGDGHGISLGLALSLTLWSIVIAFCSPFFSVQNSVGRLSYQYVGWGLFAAASIPLKFLLYPLLGLAGIPLAGVAAYLMFLLPTALLGYRATLSQVVAHD
ncbi:lipopolysaccharide biosynthesis protein [Cryobacterium sp. MLB-32]|uniref:lipopolysaccharide biosynthesis protein n=1 Tax=Cryobacterium sp. MLB-32 TaxID=1529318 RepID=UPI00068BE98A|nr:oligosaccharide flippase family protein [Cryobacterium sp. MLB-32]